MELSDEQQLAFDKYILGENIFITGPGGSGKSALIKKIVEDAKEKGKRVQVCATTGCAAVLLHCCAKTIHSWAGIGLGNGDNYVIANRVASSKYKKANWKKVQILIIDEVSMMSIKLLELLNLTAKKCRNTQKIFGGIQVIFSGDFFQLPPVGNRDEPDTQKFCFESSIWSDIFPNQIELKTIFRQKDPVYTKILNQIRRGRITRSSLEILEKYIGRENEDKEITPTILFPTRRKVEQINNEAMKSIEEEEKGFIMKRCTASELELTPEQRTLIRDINPTQEEHEYSFLKSNINCDEHLILKKGAQVMCIANIDVESKDPICNGSQGVIKDFDEQGNPIVKFKNGVLRTMGYHIWQSENIPSVAVKQIPLILAWAITIHKSQGATLDFAEIDIGSGIFECGQTYVALSRIVGLEGLYLKSFNHQKIKINKKVAEYYQSLSE